MLMNTMLIVDKRCIDVCCDEFPVLQIDRKSKQVKTVRWKFFLQSVWGKTRYFKHRKYQNLWMNDKGGVDNNAICLHFLPYMTFLHMLNICRKFEFLISQGTVTTCLRRGWQCRMGFVANFIRFLAVQNIWQSVNIWESYREFKGGNFFETPCTTPSSVRAQRSSSADRLGFCDPINDALICLHWLRVPQRIQFKLAVLTYKFLFNQARRYLGPLVRVADLPGRRALRSANTDRLLVPSVRLSSIGGRAFPIAAPQSAKYCYICSVITLSSVRRHPKTYFVQRSFPDMIVTPEWALQ